MVAEYLKISYKIKSELEEMQWTNIELADAMQVELQVVDDLLADKTRIDYPMAERLGEALEPTASYWIWAQRALDDANQAEEAERGQQEEARKILLKRKVAKWQPLN